MWFSLGFFMMGFYPGMHSVRLRFLWMTSSAQFFLWIIRPNQDRLCIKCFETEKKVYLEFIFGLIWSLLMNMSLGHKRSKVSLG
jgi:hypothetical protein